jgi:hypothetical protein
VVGGAEIHVQDVRRGRAATPGLFGLVTADGVINTARLNKQRDKFSHT